MSSPYQIRKKKQKELESILRIARAVGYMIGIILVLWFFKWAYFDVYKPKEKLYIKNSKYAYQLIQSELTELYKQKGYVYDSLTQDNDPLCEVLREKYDNLGTCNVGIVGAQGNIKLPKGITLHGFENRPRNGEGSLIKDIIIDVNGEKGENTLGVDRAPIRIYSTGRMGGMISPVNCKVSDQRDYELDYSPICTAGIDINFMDSKMPFSFSIFQIGGKKGESKYIAKNISFLRADCMAFGGELIGAMEFCEMRGYHWTTACYHDYYCAIELKKK